VTRLRRGFGAASRLRRGFRRRRGYGGQVGGSIARAIVRAAAWLVPAHYRDRWREEWIAELSANVGRSPPRVIGAPLDAIASHWTVPPSAHTYATTLPTRTDVVLAFRQIQQAPLLSAAAILALAVGIGAATVAFAGVVNIFHGTLPIAGSDRIVKIHDFDRVGGWGVLLDYREFERRRAALTSFTELGAYNERNVLVTAAGRVPEIRRAGHITVNLWRGLGVAPRVGRDFHQDDLIGADVALISDRLHDRLFDRVPSAVGQTIRIDERAYEIVGVMPEGWRFPMTSDIWVPLVNDGTGTAGATSSLHIVGRLADGVTADRAEAEIGAVAAPWIQSPGREHVSQSVLKFTESTADPAVRYGVWAFVVALVLLLCVSAANVANIVMARALSRRREMAVRSALGAGRARLVMQVTIEAAALSGLAAVIGVFGADAAIVWINTTVTDIPFWVTLAVDWRAVAFVTALSLLASIVAGVGPALRVTRGSMFDALRESTTSVRFGRVSGWLIGCETAIAIALLSATFVLAQSLSGFSVQDARLPLGRVLLAQLYFGQPPALAAADAPTDPARRRRAWEDHLTRLSGEQQRMIEQIRREPGVAAVSLASHFPGNEPQAATFFLRDHQGAERTVGSRITFADARYLDVLDTPVASGRFFTDTDVAGSHGVAVVNEPFVRNHFNGANPIGHLIKLDGDLPLRGPARDAGGWREIIGVIPDLAVNPGNPRRADAVYLPAEPDNVIRVAVMAGAHPVSFVPALHRIALSLDPRPQVQWTTTLDAQIQEPMTALTASGAALGALGGMALLLSCLGTYAIVAFSVAQRRREIAIRVAMGAGPRAIVRAILAPSAMRLLAGTLAGATLGAGMQQLVSQIPYALADTGIEVTIGMVALVSISGALACAAPLKRALALRPRDWLGE